MSNRHAWIFAAAVTVAGAASEARAQSQSVFVPVAPCRIVDTRVANNNTQIAGNTTRTFNVVGVNSYAAQGGKGSTCGIPGFVTGIPQVAAVEMNVIAVQPAAMGNLLVYPSDVVPGTSSTINFPPSATVPLNIANGVIIPVRQDSQGSDVTVRTSQATHVVIDVTGYFLRFPVRGEINATSPNVIGGFEDNDAGGAVGAAIAGGGDQTHGLNQVTDDFGFVGGGYNNRAGDATGNPQTATIATVAGGNSNQASKTGATVGGGAVNVANGSTATIAGGFFNQANASSASIGGGDSNVASGSKSTVPGGSSNRAGGENSFAAGHRAKADGDGSFVWADSTDADYADTGANQFKVRATGGIRLTTGVGPDANCLIAGTTANLECSGTIMSGSDRAAKQNFSSVDGREVLRKVLALPIETWSYKTETDVSHIGPMAQDFRQAFGVGPDDKHIATVDGDGVALAAIQGLHAIVAEKDAEIAALKARVDALSAETAAVRALEARLEKLERSVPRTVPASLAIED